MNPCTLTSFLVLICSRLSSAQEAGKYVLELLIKNIGNALLLCRGAEPRHTVVRLFVSLSVTPSFTSVLRRTLKGES